MINLRAFFFIFLYLIICNSYAQNTEIKGFCKVTDDLPVSYATVLVSEDKSGFQILDYTTTSDSGSFQLKFESLLDSVYVTASHISYKKVTTRISNKSGQVFINFEDNKQSLDPIEIQAKKAVVTKGDTLIYNIDFFKKQSDYSIEDVMARIPGITISDSGAISFNGQRISTFYINGLDLLEGQYAIATRGIPAKVIEDLEILKNHNHAKVEYGLDSDNVAVNINTKEKNVLVGTGSAKAGSPLFTYYGAITPILIREKSQFIASVFGNNSGNELSSNTTNLTFKEIELRKLYLTEADLLEKPNIRGLGISPKYWLDNESFAITADYLTTLKPEHLLKVKTYYNSNSNKVLRSYRRDFIQNDNDLLITNNSLNNLTSQKFAVSTVNEVNKKSIYLKNKFTLNYELQDGSSQNDFNGEPLGYGYDSYFLVVHDQLDYKLKIGEAVLNNSVVVEYQNKEESSITNPAVFDNIIPTDGINSSQNINTEKFNIGSSSKFRFTTGAFKWTANQMFKYSNQKLESTLNNLDITTANFPFVNDFELNQWNSETIFQGEYSVSRFKMTLSPSVLLEHLQWEEPFIDLVKDKRTFLFFQPSANITYSHNPKWKTSVFLNSFASRSPFESLYSGFVLSNFEQLSRNPSDINIIRNQSLSVRTGYRNELKGLYANIKISKNFQNADFTPQSFIDSSGLSSIEFLERENKTESFTVSTNFTKSFLNGLSVSMDYEYRENEFLLVFNDVEQQIDRRDHKIALEVEWDKDTWFGIKYNSQYAPSTSISNSGELKNSTFSNQFMFNWYLNSKSRLNLETESLLITSQPANTSNHNQLFNAAYYYQHSKKILFSVELINLFNQDQYFSIFNGLNSSTTRTFNLRPRQILLGIRYSL